MKKIIKKTVFLIAMAIAVAGCDNSEMNKQTSLKGTKWKLEGFVDTETSILTEPEPKECGIRGYDEHNNLIVIECYTLFFETNTICAQTSSKSICGDYDIDYTTHRVHIYNLFGQENGELGNGLLYHRAISSVQSFSYKGNELKLYYNDNKNYLFFKPL